jgi:hypothetical protein
LPGAIERREEARHGGPVVGASAGREEMRVSRRLIQEVIYTKSYWKSREK